MDIIFPVITWVIFVVLGVFVITIGWQIDKNNAEKRSQRIWKSPVPEDKFRDKVNAFRTNTQVNK